jgi:hypothetical protein
MRAVMFGVMTAGLDMMVFGMAGMAMGAVSVVRRLFVIAGLMVLGRFAVMLRRMFVVFGGLVMMLDAFVVAHISLPVRPVKRDSGLRSRPDITLTVSRQLCCGWGHRKARTPSRSQNRHRFRE